MSATPHCQIFLLDGDFYCYRCGAHEPFNSRLPKPVDEAARMGEDFVRRHRDCLETERGRELDARHRREWAEWKATQGDGVEAGWEVHLS